MVQGRKVEGIINVVEKVLIMDDLRRLSEEMLVLTLPYSSEKLMWHKYNKSRMHIVKMDFLPCASGVKKDWLRNEVEWNLCGVEKSLDEKVVYLGVRIDGADSEKEEVVNCIETWDIYVELGQGGRVLVWMKN